jgi:hypothetical protein
MRTLRFTISGAKKMAKEINMPSMESLGYYIKETKYSFKSLRFLTWGALLHEDENLTLEKVGELIKKYCRSPLKKLALIKAIDDAGIIFKSNFEKSKDLLGWDDDEKNLGEEK